MLTGIAPTMDDGTIRLQIHYEDENGQAAEPVEKELNLMVTEEMETEFDPSLTMDPELMEPREPSFLKHIKCGF